MNLWESCKWGWGKLQCYKLYTKIRFLVGLVQRELLKFLLSRRSFKQPRKVAKTYLPSHKKSFLSYCRFWLFLEILQSLHRSLQKAVQWDFFWVYCFSLMKKLCYWERTVQHCKMRERNNKKNKVNKDFYSHRSLVAIIFGKSFCRRIPIF